MKHFHFWWQQRYLADFYTVLNQVHSEEVPDDLKLPDNFQQLISDMKNNKYNTKTFALILKGMVCVLSDFFLTDLLRKVSNFGLP